MPNPTLLSKVLAVVIQFSVSFLIQVFLSLLIAFLLSYDHHELARSLYISFLISAYFTYQRLKKENQTEKKQED